MRRVLLAALSIFNVAVWSSSAVAQQPQGQQQAQPPAPPRPSLKTIRKLRRRFEQEPDVKDVQEAALRYFKVHPKVVTAYRRGASWKALMPEVELNLNAERGDNFRNMLDQIYLSNQNSRFQNFKERETGDHSNYTIGLKARWQFDRLIFNAEILDVASLVGVQEGLLREITSLYFTRRRLLAIFALNPPKDPGEKITESIRLDEITANIDALTGGYFSREVKRRLGTG